MRKEDLQMVLEKTADVPGPFLVFAESELNRNMAVLMEGLGGVVAARVFYALKACYVRPVLTTLARLGCGAEVMTELELDLALAVGFPAEKILCNGVGRTSDFLSRAVGAGCLITVDSVRDLDLIEEVVASRDIRIEVGVRIRPRLDSGHSPYDHATIKLGQSLDCAAFDEIASRIVRNPRLDWSFLHCHFTINQCTADHHVQGLRWLAKARKNLESRYPDLRLRHVDLGGGFGTFSARTEDDARRLFHDIGATFRELFPGLGLMVEPGRYLVNSAGVAVGSVIDHKDDGVGRYVFTDISTNCLIPIPSARYELVWPQAPIESSGTTAAIADGITSPDNIIVRDAFMAGLPDCGARIAIGNAGAYTTVFQHFWAYEPLPLYFVDQLGELTTALSRSTIQSCRKLMLGA